MTETGIQFLIDKFRQILVARMRGHTEQARALFDDITVDDFPVMPEFEMSHGIYGDPETALFYIDRDWDDHAGNDPNYCNLFIADVIETLEDVVIAQSRGQRRWSIIAPQGVMNNLQSRKPIYVQLQETSDGVTRTIGRAVDLPEM